MKSKPKKNPAKTARTASKTTAAYWSQKIYLEQKDDWRSANYFARIQARGVRRKVRLKSTIREEAAREAATRYRDIAANGWPADEGFSLPDPASADLPQNPTVEAWIGMAVRKARVRKESVEKYGESLRTVVGEILGMCRARKKEDRAKIDGFRISGLTKETLQAWLASRMEKARQLDMVRAPRAHNTIRTLVANAKGLFSKQILEAIGIPDDGLPYVPFHGLKLPTKVLPRYSSRFDAKVLLQTAAKKLGASSGDNSDDSDEAAASRFEQWKILYLALVAGLRYNEIDKLRVQDVSPAAGRITIRTHETFQPKTSSSEGDVLVSAAAGEVLAEMLKRTTGPWFVKEGRSRQSPTYRAGQYHDELLRWLRKYEERGIRPFADIPKPLHELRKEAGTLVNSQHGLNEAKNFLRHSSIATTAAYYVGSKGNITTGLS
jgi:integrase